MEDKRSFSAAERYKTLETDRQGPLDRARRNARLTLPWIMPPDGSDAQTELYDPFQNVGSRGVNHLGSKMTLAVFPANEPFWRHDADEYAADELSDEQVVEIRKSLSRYDRTAMANIESSGDRPKIDLVNKHLLVAGNVLLDIREPTLRVFSLDSYVVVRDSRGKLIELVIKEQVHPDTLDADVRAQLKEEKDREVKPSAEKDMLDLYTHVQLQEQMYHGFQEIDGVHIDGSDFVKKPDDLGFIALRFTVIDGQSYGRSFVESMYGDLATLETLTQAITDVASAAARVIFLVRKNGTTRAYDLSKAQNFDFVPGDANDVTVLRLDKAQDMRIAYELAQKIEERLGEQFLLRSSATRQAERVTAEEIRYVALELEDALSGIYSLLTIELQLPYVRLRIKQMKNLPALPDDVVKLTIVTGLEALRRGHEMQKLRAWTDGLSQVYGPETVRQYIPISAYAKRLGDSLGLDLMGLITSEEQALEKKAAEEVTSTAIQAGPSLIQGAMQDASTQEQA